MTQAKHYERFLALHQQPEAFVMPNPWDGLSALIFKKDTKYAVGKQSKLSSGMTIL